jgi:prepilin-type N-terminal cleavage/methylation domain-containing protein
MQPCTSKKHYPWNSNNGFTLIEVMIGIMIFTVGILGVTALTMQAYRSYSTSRQSTREVNRTAISVEMLKHAGYFNDNVLQDDDDKAGTDPFYAPGTGNDVEYRVQDNAVVSGTKLIVMQNDQASANPTAPAYTIFYTKPEIR